MNKKNIGILEYLKTNTIIIFAITILIMLFQFASSDKNIDKGVANNNTNIPKLTEDDRKFQSWVNSFAEYVQSDLYCITKAAEVKSLTDTEMCGRMLKEHSNKSLRQINGFNISQSFNMSLSEYRKSVEYFYMAGQNLEKGAKDNNAELMISASNYIDEGNKRRNDAHYLLLLVS